MKRAYCFILAGLLALPLYAADPQVLPTNPPSGYFNNKGNPAGKVDYITYGNNIPARVYTPPGYDENKTYASMYLLHGMGGSEASWHDNDLYAHIQLDNLIAEGRVDGFVMVFTLNEGNFASVLINDLIPYINEHYSVSEEGKHRAIGGLSMGCMLTCQIAGANPDKFHYLMAASCGSRISFRDQERARESLKLVLITQGEREGDLISGTKSSLESAGISGDIIFEYVAPNAGHDRNCWRPSFWNFAQMAHDRGFTIGDVAVREYTADHFSIAAMSGIVGVFDLRGKFLKFITSTEFSNRASDLAPGSYIIQWQSGGRTHISKYSTSSDYNRLEAR
ncbi:MAG: hypothetical protein JW768_11970 [Chitinispirillaceae bacterium]|nr:hypothetical protein [Chitinispirillaceae bacterium]